MSEPRTVLLVAFLFGVIVPVILWRVEDTVEFVSIWLPIALSILAGILIGWLTPSRIGESVAGLIGGVVLGLIADASVDSIFFSRDRNLLGLEWIYWGLILGIPFAAAAWTIRLTRKWIRS